MRLYAMKLRVFLRTDSTFHDETASALLENANAPNGFGSIRGVGFDSFRKSISGYGLLAFLDQVDLRGMVESASQRKARPIREDFALDADQVAIFIVGHVDVAGQDHRAAVTIFLRNRGITNYPDAPVGMHEKQLPRELAVIGGSRSLPLVPTGQIKRVFGALQLDADLRRGDDRAVRADGWHLLRGGSRRGGRGRSRHGAAAARSRAGVAAAAAAAFLVVTVEHAGEASPVALLVLFATAAGFTAGRRAHRLAARSRSGAARSGAWRRASWLAADRSRAARRRAWRRASWLAADRSRAAWRRARRRAHGLAANRSRAARSRSRAARFGAAAFFVMATEQATEQTNAVLFAAARSFTAAAASAAAATTRTSGNDGRGRRGSRSGGWISARHPGCR